MANAFDEFDIAPAATAAAELPAVPAAAPASAQPKRKANAFDEFDAKPETQRARAAVNGLTMGLGPRVMAVGRSLTSDDTYSDALADEYKKLDDYRANYPIEAIAYEVGGSLPTMLVPGAGAVGNLNRIRTAAAALNNPAARAAATQMGVRSLGHEIGRGGAQLGALQAGLHSRDYTDPLDVAENAAIGGAVGYGAGRVLHGVTQPLVNAVQNAAEAVRVGSNARGTALRQLRESVAEQGTDLNEAARSIFPNPLRGQTPEGQRAIVTAYHAAIDQGADEAAARAAAAAAYRGTNPLNNRGAPLGATTLDEHVTRTVAEYGRHNRVPLMAAEVLSGSERPIMGEMKSLTQGVMNGTGEGRTILANAARDRQEGAIERTRELIGETVGAGIPGGGRDYVGGLEAIKTAAQQARNIAYQQARSRARAFDIDPVLDRWNAIAQENAGQPHQEINNAVNYMRQWWERQTGRLNDLSPSQRGTGDNQILLNSYRQARAALQGDIDRLMAQPGGRESAALLRRMKNEMDQIVRRRNPFWSRANDNTAESFGIVRAAKEGRKLPLTEGAAGQELRARMGGLTVDDQLPLSAAEREAARMGVARQMYDKVANEGDTNDVAKLFMRGGAGQDEEGMRGLVGDLMTHARTDAADRARLEAIQRGVSPGAQVNAARRARDAIPEGQRFFDDMSREQIARQTYQLDKGSQTQPLLAADKKRNAIVNAAVSIMHNPNPLQVLPLLTRMMAERAGRGRDAELGRMLATATDRPHELLRLIDELIRTQSVTRNPFAPNVPREMAQGAPIAAGTIASETQNFRQLNQRRDARRRSMATTRPF